MRTLAVIVALVAMATSILTAEDHLCRNKKGDISAREACKADEVIADVREADEKMVEGCAYLGDVTASSGWGGVVQGVGSSRARNSVFKRAAQKGATHLVWSRQASGYSGANASGRAYKCEQEKTDKPKEAPFQ